MHPVVKAFVEMAEQTAEELKNEGGCSPDCLEQHAAIDLSEAIEQLDHAVNAISKASSFHMTAFFKLANAAVFQGDEDTRATIINSMGLLHAAGVTAYQFLWMAILDDLKALKSKLTDSTWEEVANDEP